MGEGEAKLGTDVFIALAAVGWADGELHRDEADAIVRCALEEGLPVEAISKVQEATMTRMDVGSIDLSKLSKADRLFVYAVGAWITRVDGNVAPEEKKALDDLGAALRIPQAPRRHASKIAEEIGELGDSSAPAFYNLPMLRKTLKVRLAEAQQLRAAERGES